MPKPTLGAVQASIADPLYSDNFQLNIPNLPNGLSENPLPLLLQMRTGTKPGLTIAAQEVQVFGHTIEYAGNLTYNHDLSFEYVENRSLQIHKIIEGWMELIRNHETQHGAYKADYARNGDLTIFDNKGEVVAEYTIINMWPTTLGDISFDGSTATVISVSITWKFDSVTKRR